VTRDDIIRLAQEAGFSSSVTKEQEIWVTDGYVIQNLAHFAALVAAVEREACALVAESYEPTCESCPSGVTNAIRARGHVNEPAKSLTRFNDTLKENGIKW